MSMVRRWRILIRPVAESVRHAAVLLVIVLLGTLCGMAFRAWGVPHLPPSVTRMLGASKSMEAAGNVAGKKGRKIAFWKSSMIPNFVSPKPGRDPMNMELVPVYMDEVSEESLIALSPEVSRNMGLRTVPVEYGEATRVVRTLGEVDYAEPLLGDVTLKIGGWVEDLYVDYVGQRVRKGQPLFTVYSPELFGAMEEFLLSLQKPVSPTTTRGLSLGRNDVFPAEKKLRFWDVPESEIARFKRQNRLSKTVMFESPFDGWVIEKHALRGMYMKPGERFYRIADLSKIWVYVTVFEYQLADVHVGQTAKLTLPFRPGDVFEGKVIYIYPYVDPKTRQIRVRLEFPNPDLRLKPAMYANVELEKHLVGKQILVPLDAVIDSGRTKEIDGESRHVGYAYAKIGEGKFEPRAVEFGEELEGGRLQILAGLKPGEQVVVSGQFQLDSERSVKEANLAMLMQYRGKQEKQRGPTGRNRTSDTTLKREQP